jgi:hypothetical protein
MDGTRRDIALHNTEREQGRATERRLCCEAKMQRKSFGIIITINGSMFASYLVDYETKQKRKRN